MTLDFDLVEKLDNSGFKLWQAFICGVFVVVCAFSIKGQAYESAYPITCEEAVYHVSDGLLQHSKRKNKDSSMIIILRPGKNESSKITTARLKSIKAFVASLKPDFTPIYGTSEGVAENGMIEIFVEGVRIYRLSVIRNKDIDFTTCSV